MSIDEIIMFFKHLLKAGQFFKSPYPGITFKTKQKKKTLLFSVGQDNVRFWSLLEKEQW